MQCNLKMIDPSGKGLRDCERPANSRKSIKFQVVVKTICPLHPETLYFIQRASMMRVPIELIPYNHREISLFNSRVRTGSATCVENLGQNLEDLQVSFSKIEAAQRLRLKRHRKSPTRKPYFVALSGFFLL